MSVYRVATAYIESHFPGEALHAPSEREWAHADRVTGTPLDRTELLSAGSHRPRNRAWMRAQVKRHIIRTATGVNA